MADHTVGRVERARISGHLSEQGGGLWAGYARTPDGDPTSQQRLPATDGPIDQGPPRLGSVPGLRRYTGRLAVSKPTSPFSWPPAPTGWASTPPKCAEPPLQRRWREVDTSSALQLRVPTPARGHLGVVGGGHAPIVVGIGGFLPAPGADRLVADLQVVGRLSDGPTGLKQVEDLTAKLGWVTSRHRTPPGAPSLTVSRHAAVKW